MEAPVIQAGVSAERLHRQHADAALAADGQHSLLEAAVAGVEHVQRHLHRVPRMRKVEHFQVRLRVPVSGEADKAHLARLLCLQRRFQPALEDALRVALVLDGVELQQIDMVGAQPPQRLVDLAPRAFIVARADLCHEEDFLAKAVLLQSAAHHFLGPPVVILPGVVEERDAEIDGLVHQPDAFLVGLVGHGVPAAIAEDGDAHARLAERPRRDAARAGLLHGEHFVGEGRHARQSGHDAPARGPGQGMQVIERNFAHGSRLKPILSHNARALFALHRRQPASPRSAPGRRRVC